MPSNRLFLTPAGRVGRRRMPAKEPVFYGYARKNHPPLPIFPNSQTNTRLPHVFVSLAVVDRYLLVECVKTWLGVVAVLLVLTLGVGFARFIADAAAGEMPLQTVFAIAGFSVLENLEIVLPVSLLLAVMLTIGRLCRDNEMAALAAGGVGLTRLYRPLGAFALVLALIAAWLSLFVAPQAESAMKQLRGAGSAAFLQVIESGRFAVIDDGKAVFYAGEVDQGSGTMRDIFVRLRGGRGESGSGETVVTAARAVQERDAASDQRTLVLHDGYRYEGQPGRADYRVTRFAEHGVRMAAPEAAAAGSSDVSEQSVAELVARDDALAAAELHRRLGVPIALVVLTLLAVPLGHLPPRSGRYGRLVLGILIYVGYANALRLAEVWIVEGQMPPAAGLWWVHAAVLALALVLLGRHEGWMLRPGRS